ncbi:MAG: carboxypeptidase regulatory-like domain-containing protein [Gemmatimonadaceae bacterium]|nr:carboxypeptidase regulatory-like domain-containing protein [Gemmatimonadaceae bacterium]
MERRRAGLWILRLVACGMAVSAGVEPLAAQGSRIVSGRVLDSAGKAVPGALLATLNAKGELVAQTLAGADGAFEMPLAAGIAVDVYAMLVGLEPSPPVAVSAGTASTTITVTTSGVRAQLSGQRNRQKAICGPPRDTTSDVTRLWQEARKAIASTGLRYGRDDISATVLFFDRTTSPDGKAILSQRTRESTVSARRPFQSLPPDSVASAGYVIETETDVSYYAPDADVLLSGPFAESHCFAIAPANGAHPTWVGLTFKPKGERLGVYEIAGTMWFDHATQQLQQIAYRYTNAPVAFASAGVGGDVAFTHLQNGAWFISRWEIRMPQGQIQSNLALQHSQVRNQRQVTVESLRVAGGEVKAVSIGGAIVEVKRD